MAALQDSPAQIVRQLLIDLGGGSDGGTWPIYATSEPSDPDNVITVYDTIGQDDGRAQIDGSVFYHYGLQVRVRAIDHPTGWAKAIALRDLLATVYHNLTTVGSNKYEVWAISRLAQPLFIGKDVPRSKRTLFTINCMCVINPQ